jgi:cytosine/adenosine deaminase-related metal-dependent hydrolase
VGPDVWYAHGVYFEDAELDLLAKTGTGIAHCPSSNLRLGSGIARVPEMLERGIPVGLAVDGSASNDSGNMVLEIRQALLVHRVGTGVDRMPVMDAIHLATTGGARVLGRDDIGEIAVGKCADLAMFSLDDIGFAGAHHDYAAAVFLSFSTGRTEYTVVNGQVVVDQGTLVTGDIRSIIDEGNRESRRMLSAATAVTGIDYLKR